MSTLRLILGDQLNHDISSLKDANKSEDVILFCELFNEATYVKHHKKKLAFIFSTMRHFADTLLKDDWQVDYVKLNDKTNTHSFSGEVARAITRHNSDTLVATLPSE